jgi:hypothetical protein
MITFITPPYLFTVAVGDRVGVGVDWIRVVVGATVVLVVEVGRTEEVLDAGGADVEVGVGDALVEQAPRTSMTLSTRAVQTKSAFFTACLLHQYFHIQAEIACSEE